MALLPRSRARFENFRTEILGVRSSFTTRLNTFKSGALRGTTTARGRSLLAALHSVAKPSNGEPAHHGYQDCPLLLGLRQNQRDCPHYVPCWMKGTLEKRWRSAPRGPSSRREVASNTIVCRRGSVYGSHRGRP